MYLLLALLFFTNTLLSMDSAGKRHRSNNNNDGKVAQENLMRECANTGIPIYYKAVVIKKSKWPIKRFMFSDDTVALQTESGINVHDVGTGKCLYTIRANKIDSFALYADPKKLLFSTAGKLVRSDLNLSTSKEYEFAKDSSYLGFWIYGRKQLGTRTFWTIHDDNTMNLYDIDSCNKMWSISLPNNTDFAQGLQKSRTEFFIADNGGVIYYFNRQTTNPETFKQIYQGNVGKVTSIACDEDNTLFSRSQELVNIWHIKTGERIYSVVLLAYDENIGIQVKNNILFALGRHKDSNMPVMTCFDYVRDESPTFHFDLPKNEDHKDPTVNIYISDKSMFFACGNIVSLLDKKTLRSISIIEGKKKIPNIVDDSITQKGDFPSIGFVDARNNFKMYKPLEAQHLRYLMKLQAGLEHKKIENIQKSHDPECYAQLPKGPRNFAHEIIMRGLRESE